MNIIWAAIFAKFFIRYMELVIGTCNSTEFYQRRVSIYANYSLLRGFVVWEQSLNETKIEIG